MKNPRNLGTSLSLAALLLAGTVLAEPPHGGGEPHGGGAAHGGGAPHGAPARGEPHEGPRGYSRVTEPKGWMRVRPPSIAAPISTIFRRRAATGSGPTTGLTVGAPALGLWGDSATCDWAPQYVIGDYWLFALEVPPAGYEWVRDGADALLIDTNSGEILQVEYGVFA